MKKYGYIEASNSGYPLAAWIWGHRLRIGQDWMEYLLEFLNVLAGFDYQFGRGINEGRDASEENLEYKRFARLGLRRFVFYHEREKTRHPDDDRAYDLLLEELRKHVDPLDSDVMGEPVNLIRSLLQAFSAVDAQRSWYAKSLFPAHHNLLIWEALRKGATKYKGRATSSSKPISWLDKDIRFDQRNFFARGGEVYYLFISAGTEGYPEKREFIASKLKNLLYSNATLGHVASLIDNVWDQLCIEGNDPQSIPGRTGKLGWIPYEDDSFYVSIADDLYKLLHANLDSLELLDLLAHLIGFHITLYIYRNANQISGSGNSENNLSLLVDAMDGTDNGTIRNISASLFSEQEAHIVKCGKEYVRQTVEAWSEASSNTEDFLHFFESESKAYFGLNELGKSTRKSFDETVDKLEKRFSQGELTKRDFINLYIECLTDLLLNDFRKNFLGVHKKLGKAICFVSPRKGPSGRFVLGDTLLKAITIANLMPGEDIIYHEFLEKIYQRYGIIVGADEAKVSGLLDRKPINERYFRNNQNALLEKMKFAGLAIEYSDATAIVMHRQVVLGDERG